jgi:glycosyltransferase involved in cell wall biosynthesis
MKIIFLNFYSGVASRGGETFVHELAQRLSQKHQVYVIQSGAKINSSHYQTVTINPQSKSNYFLDQLSPKQLLKRLFLTPRQLAEFLFSLKSIFQLIKLNPDIVIPLNSGWQALLTSIYCRLLNKKLVIVGQSGIGWNDRWNLICKPDTFVALTNRQLTWARRVTIWNNQSFAKISNGVDLKVFKPNGSKVKINLPRPILLLVAASIQSKRVIQTIAAVAKTKDVSLLLLGTGPLDNQVDLLGKRLLSNRFLHLSVKHTNMPQYYRSVDAFTLCSDSSEAFGIVYLEALATGLPVIATDDESRREIAGSVGIFVNNPDDSDEYSKAITKALQSKTKVKSIAQAAKYDWDQIATSYSQALAKLT